MWGWTRTYGTIFISVVRRGGGRESTEQYSSLLLGVWSGRESTEQYSSLLFRHGGGREYREQYSSLFLGVGVDESLWNNIHLCC